MKTNGNSNIGSSLRRLLYITSITGMGLFLNSCMAGYVASEPSYMEYSRPSRPNNFSIWIDGDWGWNSQRHAYIQKTGYWDKPRQGQKFVSGHWQTTPKGKSWSKGSWQKENRRPR
jgi:hypothetical protein